MSELIVHSQGAPLSGSTAIPGDKSISHRSVLFAALAKGTSTINNWLPSGDTMATLNAIRTLGIHVDIEKISPFGWKLIVEGQGLQGLQQPKTPLDCGNAGTCMRLLSGILSGQSFTSVLDGSSQLRRRPMGRIINPLQQMGAYIQAEDNHPPLFFRPGSLKGIEYHVPIASAQVKSAILLAALYAQDQTIIYEIGPTRDHTEKMLGAMGVKLEIDESSIQIEGTTKSLNPLTLSIPGDISSAAFPLVAAALIPHSKITIQQTGFNETRTGLVDVLSSMGTQTQTSNYQITGGEPVVDLTIQFDELHSTEIAGELVVRAIDEFPVWAVAATQAAGESTVREAYELRVKEVDRISLLAGELRKMAAQIEELPDGFIVSGPTHLEGAVVDSHGDHRLGMALAIAGLIASGSTTVKNAGCIADSFPGFIDLMHALGANMVLES